MRLLAPIEFFGGWRAYCTEGAAMASAMTLSQFGISKTGVLAKGAPRLVNRGSL